MVWHVVSPPRETVIIMIIIINVTKKYAIANKNVPFSVIYVPTYLLVINLPIYYFESSH